MMSPASPAAKRLAVVVAGATGAEDQLNAVLEPRGFLPVMVVPTVQELVTVMRKLSPQLVVLPVPTGGTGTAMSMFEAELRRQPGMAAIGTAPVKDADTVLAAMRSGITEFLVSPVNIDDFTSAVTRLLSNFLLPSQTGKVFMVYAGKGGVGTSTIATSLAWAFAQLTASTEAALVDFNTAGAGIRVMLNLNPMYDMGSVAARADSLDREYLRSVMVQHTDRVSVLVAADELDALESLELETAGRVVELLRNDYSNTVIDTDHHFNDQTLAALDAADRILLITQFDVSALRSTQRSLGIFARLGYPTEKVVVVANRKTDRDRISQSGAERVLGREINYTLPNDYTTCSSAITQGQFVQRQAPGSPLVPGLHAMAAALAGHKNGSAEKHPEKSRLSRLFGRK